MPWFLRRYQQSRCFHFITFSCYHRAQLLKTPAARRLFEVTLERVRDWYGLYVAGYVVMPEHVHLLTSEPERKTLSITIQMLKQNVSAQMSAVGAPPLSRASCATGWDKNKTGWPKNRKEPFWQPRYYDFNVSTERKLVEKLQYMHYNPVKRGLVADPADWPWSSYRHYATGLRGIVEIESEWTAALRERFGPALRTSKPVPALSLQNRERQGRGTRERKVSP